MSKVCKNKNSRLFFSIGHSMTYHRLYHIGKNKEIDELLTSVSRKGIFKILDKIVETADLDIDYIVDAGELSQEEIDELLTPIDDEKEKS